MIKQGQSDLARLKGRFWIKISDLLHSFEQMHFQISDFFNPLWTRIHWITDLSDLKLDHQIYDQAHSFGQHI